MFVSWVELIINFVGTIWALKVLYDGKPLEAIAIVVILYFFKSSTEKGYHD